MSDAQTANDQIVVSSPEQQDRKLNTRVSALLLRTRETRVCKHAVKQCSGVCSRLVAIKMKLEIGKTWLHFNNDNHNDGICLNLLTSRYTSDAKLTISTFQLLTVISFTASKIILSIVRFHHNPMLRACVVYDPGRWSVLTRACRVWGEIVRGSEH